MRSRRVLTLNPSQELILPRSGCSPSMNVGQTPGLMGTGRSSMREAVRSCGQNYWNLSGKKSLTSGQRGQRQDFQNGLANVLVKRLEMQRHLKGMKKQLLRRKRMKKQLLRRKRRKKKKKRNKSSFKEKDENKRFLSTDQILLPLLPYQEENPMSSLRAEHHLGYCRSCLRMYTNTSGQHRCNVQSENFEIND